MTTLSYPAMVQPKKFLVPMLLPPEGVHLSLAFSVRAAPALPPSARLPAQEGDVEGACTEAGGHSRAPRLWAAEGTPSFHHVPTLAQEITAIP